MEVSKFFNKAFQKKLLSYIETFSINDYANNILSEVNKLINLMNKIDVDTLPENIRSLKMQNFEDLSAIRNMTFSNFVDILNKTPALMPLAILILRVQTNLKNLKQSLLYVVSKNDFRLFILIKKGQDCPFHS